MESLPAFSVVIEWENARLAELDRSRRMLCTLGDQIREVADRVLGTCEVLLLVDRDEVDEATVRDLVRDCLLGGRGLSAEWQVVATRGLDYFQQKNEGARCASRDVVIFLDSDVVPQPGWLRNLLEAMVDASREVVAGRTFMTLESFTGRAFALFWLFPPEHAGTALRATDHFHANNVAFRRKLILEHPFPDLPTQRGQSTLLGQELAADGRCMFLHEGARVLHAPPNGLRHLVRRAMAHGRDDYLLANERAPHPYRSRLANTLWRFRKRILRAAKRIATRHRTAGLGPVGAAGAAGIAFVYYACYVAGLGLTLLDRDYVARRFPI